MSRTCTQCKTVFTRGYMIDNGEAYYCSDQCLHKNYTKQEWTELYDNGNSDSFYTEWEEDDEE